MKRTLALADLTRIGITREITGRKKNRVFAYGRFLEILDRESPGTVDP